LLLIISHLGLEAGAGLQMLNRFENVYINPFRSPDYQWYDAKGISLYHWVQMNMIEFMICTIFFIFTIAVNKYSFRLFLIGCIFFLYHIVDWFMLWWDYKTSVLFYYFINAAVLLSIAALFVPEKKQAIIKSLK
jgi:hypothetical protein